MKLPNGANAELGSKLESYCLNLLHHEGKHKARVFESILGITLYNKDVLATALHEAARDSDAAEPRGDSAFGKTYVLRFTLTTEKGSATVLSGWIIRHNENFPRLTTCYIMR